MRTKSSTNHARHNRTVQNSNGLQVKTLQGTDLIWIKCLVQSVVDDAMTFAVRNASCPHGRNILQFIDHKGNGTDLANRRPTPLCHVNMEKLKKIVRKW